MLLYINRLSSSTNKEENDTLIALCSVTLLSKEDMIHYLWVIKGDLLYLFLSLSFTHFSMIHKKRTCRLSAKIGTDRSNYGKMDTFETIY
jgi:hypothetical protein